MAITIDIDTARPYQVHVGTFLLEQAGQLVRATAGGTKAVIVTDTNVGPLYQMPVKQSLEASGYEVSICTFEAGEAHKRAETYVAILEFVAEHELSRSDVIVALGGGVVGDVAGFVAATYMRGCKFVQIPTSLLAMVDSSVGGKTAIDLAAGKNLAGAFWQPSVVIADVGCLATLTPERRGRQARRDRRPGAFRRAGEDPAHAGAAQPRCGPRSTHHRPQYRHQARRGRRRRARNQPAQAAQLWTQRRTRRRGLRAL